MGTSYAPALAASFVGVVVAAIAYIAPFGNTGVDGSPGSLLPFLGAIASSAGLALAMMSAVSRGWLRALQVLTGVAAILTAIAGYFLMQTILAIVMVAALLGLIFAVSYSSTRRLA